MSVVSVDEFRGGLNNQKMILAGCFVLAREKGAKFRLPEHIVDFIPTTEGHRRDPLLFADIFDQEALRKNIPSSLIADNACEITEVLNWKNCFERGGQALGQFDDLAIRVAVNLVANTELQNIADKVIEWLRLENAFALQLRIERDWQEYLVKKFGASNLIVGDQEITVDVDRIFGKVAKTSELSGRTAIWCCCDEDDLLVSKDALKAQAAKQGYKLYFKTDLPASIELPQERTKRSMVDFAICMGLDTYVGLSRSTFSNQLLLMNQLGKCSKGAKHYIYNNVGEDLLQRTLLRDSGVIRNNVLIGLDKHLFLHDGGQKSFAFSTGVAEPTTHDTVCFLSNLAQRNDFLSKRAIPFSHLIFPSKEIVLKDKVPPPWQDKLQSLFLSRYVAQQPALAGMTLYPLDLLMEIDRSKPVFRTLDSHMTDAGTMAVTQYVLEQWGLQYNLADFFATKQEKRRGDLTDMLKIDDKVSEEFLTPTFSFMTFDDRSSLPGNTNNVCIVQNSNAITRKRLLIFGDSFIKYALPFFAPVFRDIVYVRSATFQPDMVDLMSPDFVISSNAERYLCKVEDDASSKPMIFTQYGKADYVPPTEFIEAYAAQFSWRHYKGIYDAWAGKMNAASFKWEGLGIGKPNNQVVALDLAGHYQSKGIDPYFTFPAVNMLPGKRYAIQLDIKSDVKSVAAVYFQVEGDERFSEAKSVKTPVNCGDNHLIFILPNVRLKSTLRIDPLTSEGHFVISNPSLMLID